MSRDAPDILLYSALNIEDMLCHAPTICARSRTVQKVFMIPAAMAGADSKRRRSKMLY